MNNSSESSENEYTDNDTSSPNRRKNKLNSSNNNKNRMIWKDCKMNWSNKTHKICKNSKIDNKRELKDKSKIVTRNWKLCRNTNNINVKYTCNLINCIICKW